MLRRFLLGFGSLFLLCAFGAYPTAAGFGDVLKNIQKALSVVVGLAVISNN